MGLDTVQRFIFNLWELKFELERITPSYSPLNISGCEMNNIIDDLIEITYFPIYIEQIHLGEFWCVEGIIGLRLLRLDGMLMFPVPVCSTEI